MSKKNTLICLFFIFILSAYSVTNFIPADSILKDSAIYTDDYSLHFYHCLLVKKFLFSYQAVWGYDPFLLVGYPSCTLASADNRAWELLFVLLSFLPEGLAFKAYFIFFLLIYPFLLYCAARNFTLSEKESLIAAILGILFFYLSIAVEFVSWGMASYVFAAYISIYGVSVFYKLLDRFTMKRYFALLLLSVLAILMHIVTPLILFFPLVILYLVFFKRIPKFQHLLFGLSAVFVVVATSPWLDPIVKFNAQKIKFGFYYVPGFAPMQINNVWEPINVYLKQNATFPRLSPVLNTTFIEVLLLLFGSLGFYLWIKERKLKILSPILAGVLCLGGIGYYGSQSNFFTMLHPQRFLIPFNLFLILPSSKGIYFFLQNIVQGKSFAYKLFLFCLSFSLLVHPIIKPLKTIFVDKIYELTCTVPQPIEELIDWIQNNTGKEARILIEDSAFNTGHQYFGTHLPGLFPQYVQREYICGPRPYFAVKQGFASFTSGLLFGKDLETYSLKELQEYFMLYNVKWIICWLTESKKYFDQHPEYLIKRKKIDKFTIYEVSREPSFFFKGQGTVTADYNTLQLSNVTAEDGEVIIKYHWMRFLKTEPPLKMERVYLLDDPVGFIRIFAPPKSLRIYNGYQL